MNLLFSGRSAPPGALRVKNIFIKKHPIARANIHAEPAEEQSIAKNDLPTQNIKAALSSRKQ